MLLLGRNFLNRGYYSPRQETILAVLCILSFAGILFDQTVHINPVKSAQIWSEFATKILFLNHLHIFFTPLMLITTQSGRRWTHQMQSEDLFLYKTIVLFLSAIGIGVLIRSFGSGLMVKLFTSFWLGWSTLHNGKQFWGMSLIYRKLENERHPNKQKFDELLFMPIIFLQIAYYCLPIVNAVHVDVVRPYFFSISFILAFTYILAPIKRGHSLFSWSRFYDSRLMFYPFAMLSAVGIFATLALHGLEYLFLTEKFLSHEKSNGKIFRSLLIPTSFVLMLIGTFNFLEIGLTKNLAAVIVPKRSMQDLMLAISFAFSIFHFWTDSMMYTQKISASRNWILGNLIAFVPFKRTR